MQFVRIGLRRSGWQTTKTIMVEVLASGVFEVEFSHDEGRTYASVTLKESEHIALHYNPVAA